jgi:hypothetical protein
MSSTAIDRGIMPNKNICNDSRLLLFNLAMGGQVQRYCGRFDQRRKRWLAQNFDVYW